MCPSFATTAVVFVPLSCEISGAWGPAAERFSNDTTDYTNNERDIDFFHWSSLRMSEFWRTCFDVTLASQRARVGTTAAEGEWRQRCSNTVWLRLRPRLGAEAPGWKFDTEVCVSWAQRRDVAKLVCSYRVDSTKPT